MASLRRFWPVAAIRNSSFAPLGPSQAQARDPEDALQVREQHLTFFLAQAEATQATLEVISLAKSRAPHGSTG
jgi:hypothetical protein